MVAAKRRWLPNRGKSNRKALIGTLITGRPTGASVARLIVVGLFIFRHALAVYLVVLFKPRLLF